MRYRLEWLFAVVLTIAASQPAGASLAHANFAATDGLNLMGNAAQVGSVVRLVPAVFAQRGAMWAVEKQPVSAGFTTTFSFQVTSAAPDIADGLAFVIQNEGPTALGGLGGGIGYGDNVVWNQPGITRSLAVEFDLYDNHEVMLPYHISVQSRGLLPNSFGQAYSLGWTASGPNLWDRAVHQARITYDGAKLAVFVDGSAVPQLQTKLNLGSLLDLTDGTAWVGFTAATGSATGNHDLLSWSFAPSATTHAMPEPAVPILVFAGAGAAAWRAARRRHVHRP